MNATGLNIKATPGIPTMRSPIRALGWSLPMMLLTFMMLSQGKIPKDPVQAIAVGVTWLFLNTMFYMMVLTGKTHVYRRPIFVIASICFSLGFIVHFIELRGSMAFDSADLLASTGPFCHLVIPATLIPAVLNRTIIFPGSMLTGFAAVGTMIVMWASVAIVLGRGWCSWACFFGGYDEGFAWACRKPVIKEIDKRWTYLPWAVLLGVMLFSAALLSPVYCDWICPFKAVTEFERITSFQVVVKTVIFMSLFIGLVVILPFLSGRRIQCGLFCPFAAFQSLTNKINIFDIRIDPEVCKNCKKCIKECPTFSLDEESMLKGHTRMSCTKCGKCVDNCPREAVTYHIKGTPVALKSDTARLLFIYPAFVILSAIGGGMIAGAVALILKLITTGSMI